MTARPSVSIALTSFNGARFLTPLLESLARQSVPPLELVVGDNGSQDETLEMLEAFARLVPFPVRVTRNPQDIGCTANFIAAAERCQGELIALCDQDDVWHPDKLRLMTEAFGDPDILLAFHNSRLVAADGHLLGLEYDRPAQLYPPLTLNPWRPVYGHAQVFRRELLRWVSWQPRTIDSANPHQPMPHDQFFLFWASVLGTIAYRPEALVDYRQHDGNLTGMLERGWRDCLWRDATHMDLFSLGKAASVRQRIVMLNAVAAEVPAARRRLDEAVRRYEEVLPSLVRRARLSDGSWYGKRLWAFLHNVWDGPYFRPPPWGLGVGAMALDFGLGLLFGPYLKHLNRRRRDQERAWAGPAAPTNNAASRSGATETSP